MLKERKVLILSIIFILFLSIGIVSASDIAEISDNPNLGFFEGKSLVNDYSLVSIDDNSYSMDSNLNSIEDNLISEDKTNKNSDINKKSNDDGNSIKNNSSRDDSKSNEITAKTDEKTKVSPNSTNKTKTKVKTKIVAKNVNTYYKEKSKLNIYLKDSSNKALKNKSVKIYLNGKTYSRITDKLGMVALNLNLLPNKYNLKIAFAGDEEYKSSSINRVINVKKAPLVVKTRNTVSYYHPDTFFKAKVINKITKNPIEGIKVLFQVYSSQKKYKNFYSLTNQKGIATLNKRLKMGAYDVYTFIKDNSKKQFISYKNSKNKAVLKSMDTREIGCSSIYLHANQNESAIAFRRDSTYAASLYLVVKKWHGRYAMKQYKLTGTYFFHAITTADGWLIGTGGWDNPTVNKKIENLAGKIVASNSLKSSLLKSIKAQERKLNTGHFAIVAPDGRYAVIWRSGMIKGKLKNGEYLDVPNNKYLFRHGKYKKFSKNVAKAALKIAATDVFGLNRRNIMVYHYKRSTKDFKTSAIIKTYGSNDKGNLAGRFTAGKKDNVYYKGKYISKYKLSGTPYMKYLGTHKFGIIDKLIKTQAKVGSRNLTTNKFNQSQYFRFTLRNKKTNNLLKSVRIRLRVYTGQTYRDYYVKTDKNGIAQFNTKNLKACYHKVLLGTGNNKYVISDKKYIYIQRDVKPEVNSTKAITTKKST